MSVYFILHYISFDTFAIKGPSFDSMVLSLSDFSSANKIIPNDMNNKLMCQTKLQQITKRLGTSSICSRCPCVIITVIACHLSKYDLRQQTGMMLFILTARYALKFNDYINKQQKFVCEDLMH